MSDDTWLEAINNMGASLSTMGSSLNDLAKQMQRFNFDFSMQTVRPEHVCGDEGWRHWDESLVDYYGLNR
jgi:hypothetical protein